VFAHLNSETREPQWNFNKYLVSADGKVLKHFNQTVEPDAAEMINAIESLLQ
jgi:glutathione peroxidase